MSNALTWIIRYLGTPLPIRIATLWKEMESLTTTKDWLFHMINLNLARSTHGSTKKVVAQSKRILTLLKIQGSLLPSSKMLVFRRCSAESTSGNANRRDSTKEYCLSLNSWKNSTKTWGLNLNRVRPINRKFYHWLKDLKTLKS